MFVIKNAKDYGNISFYLDKLGIKESIMSKKRVIIKPNFVHNFLSNEGVTTSLECIQEVINWLNCFFEGEIILAENPSYKENSEEIFKNLGINEFIEKNKKIIFVNLRNYEHYVNVKIDGKFLKEISIPDFLNNESVIINLPKLKQHWVVNLTCGVKNLVGFLKNPRIIHDFPKFRENLEINERIVDLYNALSKNIIVNIVDGIYGMEKGQLNGRLINPGLIIIGKDTIEIDNYTRNFFGLKLSDVKYLELLD